MKTKEEYIISKIHEIEERRNDIVNLPLKEEYKNSLEEIKKAEKIKQEYLDLLDSKIDKINKLSDEEYEEIVFMESLFPLLELKLKNTGLTWEDFDNMSVEDLRVKFDL
jgi:hypothetical protein